MALNHDTEGLNRRNFLAGGASLAGTLLAGEARAQAKDAAPAKPSTPSAAPVAPVNCAVIGLGAQGRDLLASLSRVPGANVLQICDVYPAFLNRAKEGAPKAATVADYRQVLDNTSVTAVFIATPTHKHKEIALAAVQAGKNVYCEAPLAPTMEEAREIARAGKASSALFQVGQQFRANPQHHHVLKFVRTGVLNKIAQGRGQWHRKMSWRRAAPTPEREAEMNWRLSRATSPGLLGEIGIHYLDTANWFLKALPVSVTAFGGILQWQDGRDVPDTVQCVVEYPESVRYVMDMTLANSFDGAYQVFMGSDAAVMMRDELAWMVKEADSPLLGWEVYARKEALGADMGIALVADATKQIKEGKIPGKEKQNTDPGKNALYFAVESFVNAVREKKPQKDVDCGPLEGYQAVVTAVKANEAALGGGKIVYQKEWFDL
jgi:predicted dehydrogenase